MNAIASHQPRIFSAQQVEALKAPLFRGNVSSRVQSGRQLSYIEGWWAIHEANNIFGFDAWSRETIETKCVAEHKRSIGKPPNQKEGWGVSYIAKVRVTVGTITRDGTGAGHGIDQDLGLAHESAIKEAETDAMKRALMTFGNPFGLALYDKTQAEVESAPKTARARIAEIAASDDPQAGAEAMAEEWTDKQAQNLRNGLSAPTEHTRPAPHTLPPIVNETPRQWAQRWAKAIQLCETVRELEDWMRLNQEIRTKLVTKGTEFVRSIIEAGETGVRRRIAEANTVPEHDADGVVQENPTMMAMRNLPASRAPSAEPQFTAQCSTSALAASAPCSTKGAALSTESPPEVTHPAAAAPALSPNPGAGAATTNPTSGAAGSAAPKSGNSCMGAPSVSSAATDAMTRNPVNLVKVDWEVWLAEFEDKCVGCDTIEELMAVCDQQPVGIPPGIQERNSLTVNRHWKRVTAPATWGP
jgi:DNA recombination protein Rad52